MDGPVAFLHVVGGEEIGYAGEFVEEFVFEAEEGGWADDGRFGEYAADYFFATGLVVDHELNVVNVVKVLVNAIPLFERTRKVSPSPH